MINWPLFIFHSASILLWSILIHELGHMFYFKAIGKDVEIRFRMNGKHDIGFRVGDHDAYKDMNNQQMIELYAFGVILGMIPIALASMFFYWYSTLYILYIAGSMPDLRRIWRRSTSPP